MDYDYSKHAYRTNEQRKRLENIRASIQYLKAAKEPMVNEMSRDSRRLSDASVIVGVNSLLDVLDNEEAMVLAQIVEIHQKAREEEEGN